MADAHPTREPRRVVIVDDDEYTRDLLEAMVDADDRFELVGVARDGRVALSLVEWLRPDVVVIDLQVRGLDGLDAIAGFRQRAPGCRIVVMSAFPDLCSLADLVLRGVDLYLDKANAFAELLPALAALTDQQARA
jgi:DNA-binding NarL/FixJ family response regulator